MHKRQGEYGKAEACIATALEIYREAVGEEHPDYASSLENLAALWDEMGRSVEAEPKFLEALRITRLAYGEKHFQYSRFGNPTVAMFEQRLALLEGAEACRAGFAARGRAAGGGGAAPAAAGGGGLKAMSRT